MRRQAGRSSRASARGMRRAHSRALHAIGELRHRVGLGLGLRPGEVGGGAHASSGLDRARSVRESSPSARRRSAGGRPRAARTSASARASGSTARRRGACAARSHERDEQRAARARPAVPRPRTAARAHGGRREPVARRGRCEGMQEGARSGWATWRARHPWDDRDRGKVRDGRRAADPHGRRGQR